MVTLLDQPEKVKKIDKGDMLSSRLMKTPDYCRDAVKLAKQVKVPEKVKQKNIVIAGMGGSAIGGEILQDWLREELPIPIEVCKDYVLPAYANEDTLFFANSYSGNTEETLSAFVEAIRRRCLVIAITSGGHLLSFSEKLRVPHMIIPSQLPPRVAIPYLFFPLPVLLERMGVLSGREKEIEETIRVIKMVGEENSLETPAEDNTAKKLALELIGTIPVVYGFRQYQAVARRLKTQFNENSKVPSKHDVFPELNHNETVGWEAPEKLTKNCSIILIRDPDEPPEIRNRIETTKSLALHKAKKVLEIHASGKAKLAKMFSVLRIGDFTSIYLAILQNVDPTPVKIIDRIKMEMTKRFDVTEKLQAEIQRLSEKL
jgi:glucose/mannose-6-phosphate isomerase